MVLWISAIFTVIVGLYILIGIGLLLFVPDTTSIISSETVVDIMAFILVVVGATSAFFYELAKRDLEQRTDKIVRKASQDERDAAKIETKLSLSYVMWTLFRKNQTDEEYLKIAIEGADTAVKIARQIDQEIYAGLVTNIENTYGYLLAEKQNLRKGRSEKADPSEKEKALRIAKKIWELLENGELEKILPNRSAYKFEETCAWINLVFAENKDEEERARTIMRECIKSAPANWATEMSKQFKL